MDGFHEIHELVRIAVAAGHTLDTGRQPVVDTHRRLGGRTQQQQLLQQRVGQDGHELVGQLDLLEILHEALRAVNLLERDRLFLRMQRVHGRNAHGAGAASLVVLPHAEPVLQLVRAAAAAASLQLALPPRQLDVVEPRAPLRIRMLPR